MTLNVPSHEQRAIIDGVCDGHNVLSDSVPGTGKTTTCLNVADQYPHLILHLTFNRDLRAEVTKKSDALQLTNIEVHTYHSFATRYFARPIGNDEELYRSLQSSAFSCELPEWRLVIIDEAQDMTSLYFDLARRIVASLPEEPQLLILGDKEQSVYDFKGADPRFLTHAAELWKRPFLKLQLRETFRCPVALVDFVNNSIRGCENRMLTPPNARPGRVKHMVLSDDREEQRGEIRELAKQLIECIRLGSVQPHDIFVLAPSIRKAPDCIRQLERHLVAYNVPVYFPASDEQQPNAEMLANKLVFSTFHQSKGRERPIVLLFGFDATYYRYYNKQALATHCPAPLYVALTRASERLYTYGTREKNSSQDHSIPCHVDVALPRAASASSEGSDEASQPQRIRTFAVTDLLRFLPYQLNIRLKDQYWPNYRLLASPSNHTALPTSVKRTQKNGCTTVEDVSIINAYAVTAQLVARLPDLNLRQQLRNYDLSPLAQRRLKQYDIRPSNPLELGSIFHSAASNVDNPLIQLRGNYSWAKLDSINECVARFPAQHASAISHCERPIRQALDHIVIDGRLDLVTCIDDHPHVWEFKCVQELSIAHFLQLVVYSWLWHRNDLGPATFHLFNLLTGEHHEFVYDDAIASSIVEQIVAHQMSDSPQSQGLSDAAFLAANL